MGNFYKYIMNSDKTLYSILQVSENASDEVIRASYLALIKKYHPDSNLAFRDEATALTEELNHAYSILSNHAERSSYDSRLRECKNTTSTSMHKTAGSSGKKSSTKDFPTFILVGCMSIILLLILQSGLKGYRATNASPPSDVISSLKDDNHVKGTDINHEIHGSALPSHGCFLKGGNNVTYHDKYVGGFADDELYAPFKVEPPEDNVLYLLKIKNIWNPDIEYQIFVHGGQPPIEVNLLCGTYSLTYATGSIWYGESDLFGDDTHYYKADDTFRFYHDGRSACGHTLILYKVPNGNLDFEEISFNEF